MNTFRVLFFCAVGGIVVFASIESLEHLWSEKTTVIFKTPDEPRHECKDGTLACAEKEVGPDRFDKQGYGRTSALDTYLWYHRSF